VLARDKGQVQLSVVGKGGVARQVLLPEALSRALVSLRGDAGANDPVFASRKTGARLTERAVLGIVKRAAATAGIEAPVSPHWLRHAHTSHAIDRGATLPEVQSTLGHGNIAANHHIRLPSRAPGEFKRPEARSRSVSSMMTRIEKPLRRSA